MGAKFTPEQRQQQIATVESLYLSGHSQVDIGRQIGVSQQQVSKYLRKLQAAWLARRGENLESVKGRELARLDRLEREYWQAWERSQQDAEIVKQKVNGKGDGAKVQAEKTSKGQAGDPRFLQGIMACIETRLKIVGGFAPTKVDLTWKEALEQHGLDAGSAFEQLVQAAYARATATDGGGSGAGSSEAQDS
jgi:predicted transcriptional regulator